MPAGVLDLAAGVIPQVGGGIDVGGSGVGGDGGGDGGGGGGGGVNNNPIPAAAAKAVKAVVWSDDRPIVQQLTTYPATCFLLAAFVTVFAIMWHKRVQPSAVGSSYRQVVVRFELWRALTSAFVHSGLLHLGFNSATLWGCRRMEEQLGSWEYLLASIHLLIVAELCQQAFQHVLYKAGGLVDNFCVGYSGVAFSWMVVLSLKPDATTQTIAGVEVGGFTYVMLNLLLVKLIIRRSSVLGHLAGVWAGLLFSTGAMDFLRTRYWGVGVGAWMMALLLGSLKATAGIPIPMVDYVDMHGHHDLGIGTGAFDWSSREEWEDYALSNA